MSKDPNPLALRPTPPAPPRNNIVFTHTDHTHQYPIDPTTLGEFAIQWNADWFNGLFSVTDLPTEWVAHIQTTFHGPPRIATYAGPANFSLVLWNATPSDDQITAWVFSQVQLIAHDPADILDTLLHSLRGPTAKLWNPAPSLLPPHATLALPDENTSTL